MGVRQAALHFSGAVAAPPGQQGGSLGVLQRFKHRYGLGRKEELARDTALGAMVPGHHGRGGALVDKHAVELVSRNGANNGTD
jgi:hypothetical protein